MNKGTGLLVTRNEYKLDLKRAHSNSQLPVSREKLNFASYCSFKPLLTCMEDYIPVSHSYFSAATKDAWQFLHRVSIGCQI